MDDADYEGQYGSDLNNKKIYSNYSEGIKNKILALISMKVLIIKL